MLSITCIQSSLAIANFEKNLTKNFILKPHLIYLYYFTVLKINLLVIKT